METGWPQGSLYDLFRAAVVDSGDREAVVDPPNRAELCPGEPQRWRFSELDEHSRRLAGALARAGVGKGDVVLAQLPNIVELICLYVAVARLGAVISPVPMQYRRYELAGIADATRPRVSITVDWFKDTRPAQEHSAVLPPDTALFSLGGEPPAGAGDLAAALAAGDAGTDPADTPGEGDIYTICWTSGTTGTPKGVPRRHRHWLALLPVFEDATPLPRHATLLAPFPMVNMAAISVFLLYWLSRQGRLVLHHPLDLPVFLQQAQDERAAFTVAPPALLNMLIGNPELLHRYDLSALRIIGSGSAPLSPWMIEGFRRELGIDIVNMFGSNEGVCLVADAHDVPDAAERAVFFPRFGRPELRWRNRMSTMLSTRLADPDSGEEIAEPGRPGELRIKGPTVFDGYLGDTDRAAVFDADGYFRTGDLFEIDGDRNQYYRFTGRCKDIIVRGGMKISPEELDRTLLSHPDVADVAVAGYPDDRLGQKVAAVVVPKEGAEVTLDSLRQFLDEAGVAVFKHPEKLVLCDALPRNPLGKVLRHKLEIA